MERPYLEEEVLVPIIGYKGFEDPRIQVPFS
jgi:hypothetical protein